MLPLNVVMLKDFGKTLQKLKHAQQKHNMFLQFSHCDYLSIKLTSNSSFQIDLIPVIALNRKNKLLAALS